MQYIERYEHAGMTVEIDYDPMPQDSNPRESCNVGVMLCGHRRYRLGDEQVDGDDFTTSVSCPSCAGSGANPERVKLWRKQPYGWVAVGAGTRDSMHGEMSRILERAAQAGRADEHRRLEVEACDCPRCEGSGEIELPIGAYLQQERGASVSLPLGLIDHSGISMYVGGGAHRHDPGGWDSGQVGVIFDTTETRKDRGMHDAKREEIERALRVEVEEYAEFLRGEVYCFTVSDRDGDHLDSCCGFVGDLQYVRSRANEAAEYGARAIQAENEEQYLMACRDIATV
ncbi:MAG: hypothetical protein ACRDK7_05675 [Solirubrobacteraceae bacterium]